MIGKKQKVLDASTWLRGMSSGTDIADGGFADTRGVNLTKEPGVVYAPAARVDSDTDTVLTDEIIASAGDHNSFLGEAKLMVCENRTFVSYNGTKLAAIVTTDPAHTYQVGFTSFINYAGASFITSKETLTKWSGTSTFDHTFKTFGSSNLPHPALSYEDNAYYGDGNLLLRQTGVSVTPATILTLPADQIIMALGIDPGTGKMLISTTSLLNISGALKGVNKLQWYDGSSNKVSKVVIVGDVINSFESVGSTVYVGYGTNLGFINGSGVQFLRTLRNVGNVQDDLPYQNNITSVDNILLVADGRKILAFGEIIPGQRVSWYIARNEDNSNNIRSIFGVGNHKVGISVATTKFDTIDLSSVASVGGSLNIHTNFIYFPRPVHIRNITLEFFADLTSTTGNITLIAIDEEKTPITLSQPNGNVTNTRIVEQFVGFKDKQTALQLLLDVSSANAGLKRIIIYYDVAE